MVCLITCTATQQVISQTGMLGLTCHQEINNPPTRSGYLRGKANRVIHWGKSGQGSTGQVAKYMLKRWKATFKVPKINKKLLLNMLSEF